MAISLLVCGERLSARVFSWKKYSRRDTGEAINKEVVTVGASQGEFWELHRNLWQAKFKVASEMSFTSVQ